MASHVATRLPEVERAAELRSAAMALSGHSRISDENVAGLYTNGYDLYAQGRPEKAIHFLALAAMYRPAEPGYMLALGICQKALKHYDRAIQAFSMATTFEPTDPRPALHVAECLLALERPDEAKKLLEAVIEFARLDGGHDVVLRRAEVVLGLMRKP